MPIIYMHDDWDWGGNNSSQDWGTWVDEGGTLSERYDVWDALWRDLPQPAAPSYGYAVECGGAPFIVLDGRSQKIVGAALGGTGIDPEWDGPDTYGKGYWLGTTQMAWAKQQVYPALRDKPLVFTERVPPLARTVLKHHVLAVPKFPSA